MAFWREFNNRNQRFILTMVSKKFFVWWVATALLVYRYIDAQSWVLLSAATFGFDTFQKYKGFSDGSVTYSGQGVSPTPRKVVGTAGSVPPPSADLVVRGQSKVFGDQDQED